LPWTRVVRVGTGEGNDVQIADFAETAAGRHVPLLWRGALWAEVRWSLPGSTTPATPPWPPPRPAWRSILANPTVLKLDALARFRGVKRRQEVAA
jgi:UDP-N-acetylmuramate: L-alanyl-gamma-D-glutamyl-meso-diaminopimelate ligase